MINLQQRSHPASVNQTDRQTQKKDGDKQNDARVSNDKRTNRLQHKALPRRAALQLSNAFGGR